jgi:hypothetical protein
MTVLIQNYKENCLLRSRVRLAYQPTWYRYGVFHFVVFHCFARALCCVKLGAWIYTGVNSKGGAGNRIVCLSASRP